MRPGAARTLALLAVVCGAGAFASVAQEKVIDVRAVRPPTGNSFEALWGVYAKAEQRGDQDGRRAAHQEIRKYRVEGNIRSLEPIALARVGQGCAASRHGSWTRPKRDFRAAIALDPTCPTRTSRWPSATWPGGRWGSSPPWGTRSPG